MMPPKADGGRPGSTLILTLAAGLAAASLAFYAVPLMDLRAADLFFDGQGFPVAKILPVEWLRVMLYLTVDIGFLLTVVFAVRTASGGRILGLGCRDWIYQVSIFLLGPGLIVNRILKTYWGRARPFEITAFGGEKTFSPAWVMSDQCASNCSFVSGEMAGATALAICLWIVLRSNRGRMTRARFRAGQALALAMVFLTASQRMAVGRHFLSDVVIAGLIVALLAALLRPVIYRGHPV